MHCRQCSMNDLSLKNRPLLKSASNCFFSLSSSSSIHWQHSLTMPARRAEIGAVRPLYVPSWQWPLMYKGLFVRPWAQSCIFCMEFSISSNSYPKHWQNVKLCQLLYINYQIIVIIHIGRQRVWKIEQKHSGACSFMNIIGCCMAMHCHFSPCTIPPYSLLWTPCWCPIWKHFLHSFSWLQSQTICSRSRVASLTIIRMNCIAAFLHEWMNAKGGGRLGCIVTSNLDYALALNEPGSRVGQSVCEWKREIPFCAGRCHSFVFSPVRPRFSHVWSFLPRVPVVCFAGGQKWNQIQYKHRNLMTYKPIIFCIKSFKIVGHTIVDIQNASSYRRSLQDVWLCCCCFSTLYQVVVVQIVCVRARDPCEWHLWWVPRCLPCKGWTTCRENPFSFTSSSQLLRTDIFPTSLLCCWHRSPMAAAIVNHYLKNMRARAYFTKREEIFQQFRCVSFPGRVCNILKTTQTLVVFKMHLCDAYRDLLWWTFFARAFQKKNCYCWTIHKLLFGKSTRAPIQLSYTWRWGCQVYVVSTVTHFVCLLYAMPSLQRSIIGWTIICILPPPPPSAFFFFLFLDKWFAAREEWDEKTYRRHGDGDGAARQLKYFCPL